MSLCPACGQQNPEIARFCLACATELGSQPVRAAAEERKVVSVLFCDLVGFTAASEASDPEDVRARLRPYHASLRAEIERWAGVVEKFIGDAVMAVFGAPVAHEDDAERAVRAALRILEVIEELNEHDPGLALQVRIGVNTGEAVVAIGAKPEEGEAFVTGDVVNSASRLQGVAPVGGVVVGEITYRATKDIIEYQELQPVEVKGKSAPLPIWRALGARSRFGVDLERPKTPFLGREDDLAILTQTFIRAFRESSVQLVTVVGEPGVGKTRVVTEFANYVDDLPEVVFWRQGRCLHYGEGITFWALGEVVKAQAGILESDEPESAAMKLSDAVDLVIEDEEDRPWVRDRLGSLVGIGDPGEEADREESWAAWRRFLEGVASTRPLVIVIEDTHWADDSMLGFLEYLLERVTDVPLFVVCTARPELFERHPEWGGGKRNSTTLSLSPLSDEDTARLIGSLLDQAVLPAETQAALLERAGGNPLYAEEFVRMLLDRGVLRREGGAWTVAADIEIPVPESVHALIAARLDTLPAERKSLLQDAAVVGKVFWSGALASMGRVDEAGVHENLRELARKELVRPARQSSVQGQTEYSFWHALIRDVAYGQIPRAARAARHRAAAEWIEASAGERVGDHADFLAYHFTQALDLGRAAGTPIGEFREPARRFLRLAGDRARNLDAGRAASYYRQALELTSMDDPVWPELVIGACEMSFEAASGGLGELERDYERAIDVLLERGEVVRAGSALVALSNVVWVRGEAERSEQLTRRAIELLEQEPPGPELAKAYSQEGSYFEFSAYDSTEGRRWSERALSLAVEVGADEVRAHSLQIRGASRCSAGDPGGLDDMREGLRLALDLGLGREVSTAYINLADLVWFIDGPLAALPIQREGVDFSRRRGLIGSVWWATAETCWTLYDLGRWDDVLGTADEVSAWEGDEYGYIGSLAQPTRARVLVNRGSTSEASQLKDELLERARRYPDPQVFIPSLAAVALIESAGGSRVAAVNAVTELSKVARAQPGWAGMFVCDVMRVCLSVEDLDLARSLLDGLQTPTQFDLLSRDTAVALLTGANGGLDEAATLHDDLARAWRAFGNVPETGYALRESGRCLLALRRSTEATIALHQAREIFVGLAAPPLIAETDELLSRATALSS